MTSSGDHLDSDENDKRVMPTAGILLENNDVPSEWESIKSIVADGDYERGELARNTARAVFQQPALVTPRRIKLLGEEGLAAFVAEVRSIAMGFIKRERERPTNTSRSSSSSTGRAPNAPATNVTQRKEEARKPDALLLKPVKKRSKRELLKRRLLRSSFWTFVFDSVVYTTLAAAMLTVALAALHLIYI